jgi:hypothetical protein
MKTGIQNCFVIDAEFRLALPKINLTALLYFSVGLHSVL